MLEYTSFTPAKSARAVNRVPASIPPRPTVRVPGGPLLAIPGLLGSTSHSPGQHTFAGLNLLQIASLIGMVFAGLSVVSGIVAIAVSTTIAPGIDPVTSMPQALGALLASGVAGFAGLVCLIVGLLGLHAVHQGRREFGPEHEASVQKGMKWLACSIALAVAGFFVGYFMVGFVEGYADTSLDADDLSSRLIIAVSEGVANVFVAYTLAVSLQSFAQRLMTHKGRARRSTFIAVSLVAAVATATLNVAGLVLLAPRLGTAAMMATGASLGPFASVISIYSIHIYWKQLKDAQAGAQNMIRSGRFDPDAITPAARAAPYPYAGAPPAPGPAPWPPMAPPRL